MPSLEPVLLGASPRIREIAQMVPKLARSRVPVLLLGESGTGKDVVARAIHEANPTGSFVPIDCTALSAGLFESELFGHTRGAFTGAVAAKSGLIDMADGGTAFFDEIGDVPLEMQVKLLRLLQRKEFRPVGSPVMRKSDFRTIAATNADMSEMVARGTFRRDLYYRLKVVTIRLPPLRERKEDVPLLVSHFLAGHGPGYRLAAGVMESLISYAWPGNVRELEHCIAAMVAMSSGTVLQMPSLTSNLRALQAAPEVRAPIARSDPPPQWTVREPAAILPLAEVERMHIARALEATSWDCSETARMLGIGRTTLYRKIKAFGLERKLKALSVAAGADA